ALLFRHYAFDDLLVAGLPPAKAQHFFDPAVEPAEKWRLLEPFWRRCQHTGYLQAVTLAVAALFDEHEWSASAAERITARMRAAAQPGLYRRVLATAGVSVCQVNSLEDDLFCDSHDPELLQQDLSLLPLSTNLNPNLLAERSGLPVGTLADWHA